MKKNNTLNFLKGIACLFVIFIHIKFPDNLGIVVDSIARFAVPLFFMISGYFVYNKDNNYLIKQFKKILFLALCSVTFYFLFSIVINYLDGNYMFLSEVLNFENLKYFILFNTLPFGSHLWYLFALLYVYIIYFIIKNVFKNSKIFDFFIPVLLILGVFIEYLVFYNVIRFNYIVVRNFLFIGLSFFLLGRFINKHIDCEFIDSMSNRLLIISIICSFLYSILESFALGFADIYLGTVMGTILLFIYAVKNPNIISSNNIFVTLGERYSLYIYIFHCVFISIFNLYFESDGILGYLMPFLVAFCTFIVSYLYYKIKYKIVKN